MANKTVSRRNIIGASAATFSALAAAPLVLAATHSGRANANVRLRIDFIGMRSRCQAHLENSLNVYQQDGSVEFAAVCDVLNRLREKYVDKIQKATFLRQGQMFFLCAAIVPALWREAQAADFATAPVVQVEGERVRLSSTPPRSWAMGTRLRHLQTLESGLGTPAPGAILADSLIVKHGDRVLERSQDYLVDDVWGSLGLGPNPTVTCDDWVTVDYQYSLRRIDSRITTADGHEVVRSGVPHLTTPQPPPVNHGEKRLANIFIDYHSDGETGEVFTVQERADQATTATTRGRIPNTLAKIASGDPVKIVCWGDSVTAGGDASSPEAQYTAIFAARLRERFPDGTIALENVSVGGSHSRQWLWPERFTGCDTCRWQRIVDAEPDLVTIEFVNDASMSHEEVKEVYGEILQRLKRLDAEVILITPHFTMPSMMRFESLRDPDHRPYVLALREFAASHNLGMADASARWEHLWKEGIPYVTLLRNGINHPDDRGHALFAEELMKCFD